MMINEIKSGGMEVWFVSDELFQLALLMDEAAHVMRESPDWKDMSKGIVEQIEMMSAFFTASAVACQAQTCVVPNHQVWFRRENATPVLHQPE